MSSLSNKSILLVISGGIAAYKSLILIRRLKDKGAFVRCILTKGGAEFVTPLSVAALSEQPVYQDLFSLKDEAEMGHIRLSREADLIVVAPASADLMAKAAHGFAGDLAATCLLASSAPVVMAPAMNALMWQHPATQANRATLEARGVRMLGPAAGDLACREVGSGRMLEPEEMTAMIEAMLVEPQSLAGKQILVTAGPTREPLDPVRFVSNHSSGKQGYAIAQAMVRLGAEVTLVTGPTNLEPPLGVSVVRVETAEQMLAACQSKPNQDAIICVAAVADWKADSSKQKMKKSGDNLPQISWRQNPDILATLSQAVGRPELVIGFAAETQDLAANATAKLKRKGCDWILANDVSQGTGVFGGDRNSITLVTDNGADTWSEMSKFEVAAKLANLVAEALK